MGNEAKGHGLIGAVTHNAVGLSIVQAIDAVQSFLQMIIKGQGDLGPTTRNFVGRDSTCSMSFVGQSYIAGGTKGDLIASMLRGDAVTIDQFKWKNMKAFDAQYHAETGTGGHDNWTQKLDVEDALASDNFVYTPAN